MKMGLIWRDPFLLTSEYGLKSKIKYFWTLLRNHLNAITLGSLAQTKWILLHFILGHSFLNVHFYHVYGGTLSSLLCAYSQMSFQVCCHHLSRIFRVSAYLLLTNLTNCKWGALRTFFVEISNETWRSFYHFVIFFIFGTSDIIDG